MNEFDLIRRYFSYSVTPAGQGGRTSVALGVGDDCALLTIGEGRRLAVTTDTLVTDVHFPADGAPALIARRALRVNLSDLAAMGAEPLGFQLALTLPEVNEQWLELFSAGLAEDSGRFNCPLVGGDTTRGPLSITITAFGTVDCHNALTRKGAREGDIICVSGTLGDGAAALQGLSARSENDYLGSRYWLPEPRLALGKQLAKLASAGLDISDGLFQDAGHIARAGELTAVLELARLPVSATLLKWQGEEDARTLALSGGDDYEICFTAGEEALTRIEQRAGDIGLRITRVGRMEKRQTDGTEVVCIDKAGKPFLPAQKGYNHFHE